MSILKGAKAIGAYIGMSVATFHRHKDIDGIPYFRAGRTICAKTDMQPLNHSERFVAFSSGVAM